MSRILESIQDPVRPCLIQWGRILRWRVRVSTSVQVGDFFDSSDFLHALFGAIFSMRDWLIASRPALEHEVLRLYRESDSLRIVRDLANGAKHLDLASPSTASSASVFREWSDEGEVLTVPIAGQGSRPAFALADAAIGDLQAFLVAKGLAVPAQAPGSAPSFAGDRLEERP